MLVDAMLPVSGLVPLVVDTFKKKVPLVGKGSTARGCVG